MRRVTVIVALLLAGGFTAITEAQDDPQATIEALEARVTDLEADVAALQTAVAEPSDQSSEQETKGDGNSDDSGNVPMGDDGAVGDWTVRVNELIENPTEIDPAATWFLDWLDDNPAPAGSQYLTIQVTIVNQGSEAAYPNQEIRFGLIGNDGFEYDFAANCGSVPGVLSYDTQLRPGESIDVNLCWIVADADRDALVLWAAESGTFDDDDQVEFALD